MGKLTKYSQYKQLKSKPEFGSKQIVKLCIDDFFDEKAQTRLTGKRQQDRKMSARRRR